MEGRQMSPTNLAILATVQNYLHSAAMIWDIGGNRAGAHESRRHAEMLANMIRAEEADANARARRAEMGIVK
jgi:hypothetical protein